MMEWPLAYAPYANIIVEEESGEQGEGEKSARTSLAAQSAAPPDATHAEPQRAERHIHFVSEPDVPSARREETHGSGDETQAPLRFRLRPPTVQPTTSSLSPAVAETSMEKGAAAAVQGPGAPRRILRLTVATASASAAATTKTAASIPRASSVEKSERKARRSRRCTAISTQETGEGGAREKSASKKRQAESTAPAPPVATTSTSFAPSSSSTLLSPAEQADEARRLRLASARPSSLAECLDWWMYLCYYDTHALFVSQTCFEDTLRPLASFVTSASNFYAALNNCFENWRQSHWDVFVMTCSSSTAKNGNVYRGRRRTALSSSARVVYDPAQLDYANAAWYEALRVQRLMVQQLLLFSVHHSRVRNNVEEHEVGDCTHWWFHHACPVAFYAALGEPPQPQPRTAASVSSTVSHSHPLYRALPGPRPGAEAATTLVSVSLHTDSENDDSSAVPQALHLTVPTAVRMLTLLRVVDGLWNAIPTSLAFRLPVTEMEAPHYYRSIKDPVSLCQLYEDIFAGMTASSLRLCQRHQEQTMSKVQAALRAASSSAAAVAQAVSSSFIGYAHLRERLNTMKTNCDEINGAGSELSQHAQQLRSTSAKLLRDAAASEDGRAVHLQQLQAQTSQSRDALGATVKDTAEVPHLLPPFSMEELEHELFPPSDDSVVQPPGARAATITSHTAGEAREVEGGSVRKEAAHGAPPRRLLQLPRAAATAAPALPLAASTDFWVQCDHCHACYKLASRLDPVPETWTCALLGLACSEQTTRRRRGRPATATTTAAQKRALKGSGASANEGATKQGDDGETPLAAMFPVHLDALAEAEAASDRSKRRRRRRRSPRGASAKTAKKARTARSTPSPSPSTSSSSSSCDSESSSDSGSNTGSSSASSSSLDSRKGEGSSQSRSEGPHRDKRRVAASPRGGRRSRVQTHALPKFSVTSAGKCEAAKETQQGSAAALAQLRDAVAELERRPVHDNSFAQLEEVKRLEKQLNALAKS
ncbi:hypothetical protein ABL78_7457 [Leptomonas seymouri]|uniref:Bromo domain-containing protein n=1 Tax=Leptomonas seymouri TaxID=5684 RepID=A0A0N1PAH7_LEPSE|nr:hypothetical protein ABL78_7457 [Leptomonas seymouri]|eukprot:KPI83504.1 hypothetical protein ABL78_7457 [Leptomonas seymouri]